MTFQNGQAFSECRTFFQVVPKLTKQQSIAEESGLVETKFFFHHEDPTMIMAARYNLMDNPEIQNATFHVPDPTEFNLEFSIRSKTADASKAFHKALMETRRQCRSLLQQLCDGKNEKGVTEQNKPSSG